MIDKLWSGQNKAYWLLTPFSLLYGMIVWIRRKLYQSKVLKSNKFAVPIIVVGNLSVGGNGKTPLVVYLIEQFTAKGYKVGVVSRGYGGKSEHYPLIIDKNTSTKIAGDEPILIYQRTHVPIAISPCRSDAVQALLDFTTIDVIITDDGLQHYALQRDIEIVVVDGKRGFGNGCYLPPGPMRESVKRLKLVDYIVVNGQSSLDFDGLKTYTMQLRPVNAINLLTKQSMPVSELNNVVAMAGIGAPNRFFTTLSTLGINCVNTYAFADHYRYSEQELSQLVNQEQTLLMTEKDAVKCMEFAQSNWWYLPVNAELSTQFFDNLYCKISKESSSAIQ